MALTDVLDATVSLWRRTAFVPGQADCLLSCADYARALSGVDVGAYWRGTYSTQDEALAIVETYGGARVLLGGALRLAGFEAVSEPARGDVVVVRVPEGEVGGLCLGDRLALRLSRGIREIRFRPEMIVGAWRWPL